MAKSIYEMLMNNWKIENNTLVLTFNKEMIERVFKDWQKIDTQTTIINEGRIKRKQNYPDLNDLIAYLWDKRLLL